MIKKKSPEVCRLVAVKLLSTDHGSSHERAKHEGASGESEKLSTRGKVWRKKREDIA